MVPNLVICIDPGALDSTVIAALTKHGVTILYESQEAKTQDVESWVSALQTEQAWAGTRKETRPPWIRKATGRAPRSLGPKGSRR